MRRGKTRIRKDRTLTDSILRSNPRYTVIADGDSGLFAIFDREEKKIILEERWTTRKAARDYLAVSLILSQIFNNGE